MSYYAQDTSYFSRRAVAFVAIIVLHVLAIWAFASGFAKTGVRYVQTILQTNIIETEKPKDLPPPPPPVELKERPPVQVVAPDINISVPVDVPPPIMSVTTQAPPPVIHTAPPAPPPPGTAVKIKYAPDPQDYYPESSRRAGVEGRTTVKVCTDQAGKPTSADVATTSGNPDLDEAAIKYAKSIRFVAATSAGKPVPGCATLPVKFQLHGG